MDQREQNERLFELRIRSAALKGMFIGAVAAATALSIKDCFKDFKADIQQAIERKDNLSVDSLKSKNEMNP